MIKIWILYQGRNNIFLYLNINLIFLFRFFFPKLNIDEDTCSGSGHCQIVPYWLEIFKKTSINSIQVNKTNNRYSKMVCKLDGDRIILSG